MVMPKRPICGDCPDCRRATNRLLRVPVRPSLPGPAPTAAKLERHAKLYGPVMVAETAAEYGISVAIERPKPRRRGGGPSLKTRVRTLLRDGYKVDQIAAIEDLTPRRARQLVEELS